MSKRQLQIVVAIVAFLSILVTVLAVTSSDTSEQGLSDVQDLSSATLDRITLSDSTSEAVLYKEDGMWMVGGYPVVPWLLDDLWDVTSRLNGADLIAANPENHPLMGVTINTGSLVQFARQGQTIEEFMIGDREFARPSPDSLIISPWTQQASMCFIRKPETNEVYGVYCDQPSRFLPVPTWWADPVIATVNPRAIQSITLDYPRSEVGKSYTINRISGIEWRLDNSEQESNLTKTVDLTEQFRQLIADAYMTKDEIISVDFTNPDATVSLVLTDENTGVSSEINILFLWRDSDLFHVKDAEKDWSYLLTATSTAAILRPRDWFLTALKPPSTTTSSQ